MAIVVVHGIHNDGGVVEQFGYCLKRRGFEVKFFDYPKRSFIGQWFGTHKKDGAALANFMRDGDDIICHSNGALLWQESIKSGAKWNKCFVFAGAATSDKMPYPSDAFKEAHIVYNPKDLALRFGSWLPFHPFGQLGYSGYRGVKDNRIENHSGYANRFGLDHDHYFTVEKEKWLTWVEKRLC